ncbi:MAG TPA: hypothetical protein VMT34_00805 [Aggregatilineales bacterium]|nr:hypothetical protein [Aggregatilineales bacterium]
MVDESSLWSNVPEPEPSVNFIVDPAQDNEFTVVADKEVAGYDVAELMYLVGGVWRITIEDTDDNSDEPSAVYNVVTDRRYKVDECRDHPAAGKPLRRPGIGGVCACSDRPERESGSAWANR